MSLYCRHCLAKSKISIHSRLCERIWRRLQILRSLIWVNSDRGVGSTIPTAGLLQHASLAIATELRSRADRKTYEKIKVKVKEMPLTDVAVS